MIVNSFRSKKQRISTKRLKFFHSLFKKQLPKIFHPLVNRAAFRGEGDHRITREEETKKIHGKEYPHAYPKQSFAKGTFSEPKQYGRHGNHPEQGMIGKRLLKISLQEGKPASGHTAPCAGDPQQMAERTDVIKNKQKQQARSAEKRKAEGFRCLLFHARKSQSFCGAKWRRGIRYRPHPPPSVRWG